MSPTNIGWAIQMMKDGHRVCRHDWCDKSKFLWFKPPTGVKSEWCRDQKLRGLAERAGGTIQALGSICMYSESDGVPKVMTGWIPDMADLLAEDWDVVGVVDGMLATDASEEG